MNPRPPPCEGGALPAELNPQNCFLYCFALTVGFMMTANDLSAQVALVRSCVMTEPDERRRTYLMSLHYDLNNAVPALAAGSLKLSDMENLRRFADENYQMSLSSTTDNQVRLREVVANLDMACRQMASRTVYTNPASRTAKPGFSA